MCSFNSFENSREIWSQLSIIETSIGDFNMINTVISLKTLQEGHFLISQRRISVENYMHKKEPSIRCTLLLFPRERKSFSCTTTVHPKAALIPCAHFLVTFTLNCFSWARDCAVSEVWRGEGCQYCTGNR